MEAFRLKVFFYLYLGWNLVGFGVGVREIQIAGPDETLLSHGDENIIVFRGDVVKFLCSLSSVNETNIMESLHWAFVSANGHVLPVDTIGMRK